MRLSLFAKQIVRKRNFSTGRGFSYHFCLRRWAEVGAIPVGVAVAVVEIRLGNRFALSPA